MIEPTIIEIVEHNARLSIEETKAYLNLETDKSNIRELTVELESKQNIYAIIKTEYDKYVDIFSYNTKKERTELRQRVLEILATGPRSDAALVQSLKVRKIKHTPLLARDARKFLTDLGAVEKIGMEQSPVGLVPTWAYVEGARYVPAKISQRKNVQ